MSGGQKARGKHPHIRLHFLLNLLSVSLARAVYSRASLLLLDDVLSAGKWAPTPLNMIAELLIVGSQSRCPHRTSSVS